ncbi:3-hydroxyisobutyrate dehydrogenase [Marisediminitalea aggregata]|jgi:3-hydroxyisobutyrate dehydrogenase|uniref:3-hydroxyisobutyrate dehydrogenase n=1 Tax=Marisediminitalea aggregata TaxID=634436 RepID=A0A1M5ITH8_9ALTE|nr:3-hydroxyisobutyrate dehydrogenase [Marisediminitalea aggregata]MAP19529.1 3-hydroxyisobutyrate dehydrogenase [Alteromonadaceae bacterium]MEC7824608.1 3-hydroxyisobutyrate dehydrogenase [Pseudomonadota bacterium]BBO27663.1 3-hydroxyisobutyrate dehydrogenase [Alteromonas sp. I4]MAX44154.1 3-hydroxyisobutyrate dehydrogenase [Alteromonadaceae bacterium]SHG31556.1 3-hydroxyisobutyrate dehydrogenase [Marisediminitalea aggregata]|tara:strand:+ start:102906 stop:103793 length:888 start_codon:yes stop_codon:yes gene_type:complete
MKNIAFIGLGNMGGPMAANLVRNGESVVVFDLVADAVKQLEDKGAMAAASPQEAVKNADVVVTMLPAAQHVKSLYLGEQGIIAHAKTGALFIDCSTIDAQSAKEVGAGAINAGYAFIDAPVSGGVAGAAAGTLTFIMGGDDAAVSRAKPVLKHMGANLFHAGELGAGQIAKLCNNMLLSVLMTGTSEALQLAIANGLDPKVMSDIMLQSSGCNWTLQKYNPCPDVMDNVPSSNQYQGGFMVKLMNKDLSLAMEAAQQVGASTPMAAAAQALYRMHQLKGNADRDFSSIFELLGNA